MKSGIMNIPMVLGIVIANFMAGMLTRKIGYFTPWMYPAVVMSCIGAGLISTFTTTTGSPKWIGYQVLYGLGSGLGMQQPGVAAQTVLARKDVPTGVSLIFFVRTLGSSIFISIANNIFDNQLKSGIDKLNLKDLTGAIVTHIGATDLRRVIPVADMPAVLEQYNQALVCAFYVAVAASCSTVVGASLMEWKSLKKAAAAQGDKSYEKPKTPPQGQAQTEQGTKEVA